MLHLVLGGLLLLFNAGSTVFNQMAIRADGGKMAWSPAISASTTEAFKLAVALVFLVRALATATTDKSGKSSVNMPTDFRFCVKYAVPGLLYALAMLNYTAVEYLGSTNYRLLNNVKIITTTVPRAALSAGSRSTSGLHSSCCSLPCALSGWVAEATRRRGREG